MPVRLEPAAPRSQSNTLSLSHCAPYTLFSRGMGPIYTYEIKNNFCETFLALTFSDGNSEVILFLNSR